MASFRSWLGSPPVPMTAGAEVGWARGAEPTGGGGWVGLASGRGFPVEGEGPDTVTAIIAGGGEKPSGKIQRRGGKANKKSTEPPIDTWQMLKEMLGKENNVGAFPSALS